MKTRRSFLLGSVAAVSAGGAALAQFNQGQSVGTPGFWNVTGAPSPPAGNNIVTEMSNPIISETGDNLISE